jgi:hypothetical protein
VPQHGIFTYNFFASSTDTSTRPLSRRLNASEVLILSLVRRSMKMSSFMRLRLLDGRSASTLPPNPYLFLSLLLSHTWTLLLGPPSVMATCTRTLRRCRHYQKHASVSGKASAVRSPYVTYIYFPISISVTNDILDTNRRMVKVQR